MTQALGMRDVGDFGKCSLRLELAGRQFVTRAGATPDGRSKSSTSAQQIHPVRKFMPERIDPQSPREDNPHPQRDHYYLHSDLS
jgi:hypothetical protein